MTLPKLLKLHNLRIGFATNSSSTHSVVWMKDGAARDQFGIDGAYFGWEWFRLTTPEAKSAWLVAQIYGVLANEKLEPAARFELMAQWFGEPVVAVFRDVADEWSLNLGVDHQSQLNLPLFPSEDMRATFMKGLHGYLMRDDVAVLGGNDNDDEPEGWTDDIVRSPLSALIDGRGGVRIRQDGENWSLFSTRDGTKIRLGFGDAPYRRAGAPELLDVKVTDRCPFACDFCYQGSTNAGLHADRAWLQGLWRHLQALQVFEVALGGGEPTIHPEFTDVLNDAAAAGLSVAFTTFTPAWTKRPEVVETVKKTVRGIGVSVHGVDDLDKVVVIGTALNGKDDPCANWSDRAVRMTAQHVVGSLGIDETLALIEAAANRRIPLLLLGWKTTGFGANGPKHVFGEAEEDRIGAFLENASWARISVDTAFANRHGRILQGLNVPDVLVNVEEGAFSGYVDAVTRVAAASSYCVDTLPLAAPEDFKAAWDRIEVQ